MTLLMAGLIWLLLVATLLIARPGRDPRPDGSQPAAASSAGPTPAAFVPAGATGAGPAAGRPGAP